MGKRRQSQWGTFYEPPNRVYVVQPDAPANGPTPQAWACLDITWACSQFVGTVAVLSSKKPNTPSLLLLAMATVGGQVDGHK